MDSHDGAQPGHPVVVGVAPGQSPRVVREAARFAAQFGSELICACANPARFATGESPDGSVTSSPLDPDFADESEADFDPKLAEDLAVILSGRTIRWRTLAIPGEAATALGHLAETVDAAMIVVGARQRAMGGGIQELLSHSVAAKLARRQHRPVVVVPAASRRNESASDRPAE
ncbi:universal stress protein [Arthrobacter gandavensis]|uniref:universal stress protein n=1 Tax=Arthrobacter gandavensis TaxID=169960 RepID=UPI0018901EDA|nr:universal stress protein [Arthrobacter gandavensis]MBF4994888.1 universal stress protein [Arthrobacter gandavensis]